MSDKQNIVNAVAELPEDCSIEDAQQKLYVLQKIQRGIAQLDRGEGIAHDKVKQMVGSWNKS